MHQPEEQPSQPFVPYLGQPTGRFNHTNRALAIQRYKKDIRMGSGIHVVVSYSNPIWIVRRIPQESFSQQTFSLHNSFRIAI
jgi:gamma-glutamylcysteine synthetase